jgi:hypothetical protein
VRGASHTPNRVAKGTGRVNSKPRLALVVMAAALLSACSSTARTQAETTTVTTTVAPPSTVLHGADGLRVPFVADNGALTALRGSPPRGVSADQAVAEMRQALGQSVQTPPTQPPAYHPVAASVSLIDGLGVAPLWNRSAWIIPFVYTVVPSCPDFASSTTLPPWASDLQVAIVTTVDPRSVVIYTGAGAGLCAPRATPIAYAAQS